MAKKRPNIWYVPAALVTGCFDARNALPMLHVSAYLILTVVVSCVPAVVRSVDYLHHGRYGVECPVCS